MITASIAGEQKTPAKSDRGHDARGTPFHSSCLMLAADKSKMCALGAAMRKLVHICYGVFKHQTPYQSQTVQH